MYAQAVLWGSVDAAPTSTPARKKSRSESKMIDFEHVWDLYDYKVGKHKARLAWEGMSYDDQQWALASIPPYVACTFKDGRYPSRAHLSTYLNQRRYEDEELPQVEEEEPLMTYYEMLNSGIPMTRFEKVDVPGKAKPMWRKRK